MFRAPLRNALSAIVALGVGAVVSTVAASADAYVVKKTTAGELVHWDERDVSYSLDPSIDAAVNGGTDATKRAMESWSGSVGAPDLHAHASNAESPTKPGFDNKNGVFYMKDGWAPAGRALAITVLTYDNTTGKILDADVIFNGVYSFAVLTKEGQTLDSAQVSTGDAHLSNTDGVTHADQQGELGQIYDLHHVIAHELGHSLGMNDELERHDALMYRYTSPNDATLRSPAGDDISGLAELYSTKLEASGSGCGGATVAPKKPGAGAQHAAIALGLGLMLFLALRARSDRKARIGFVLAAATAAVLLMPSPSKSGGTARAAESAQGHARAKVFSSKSSLEDGLIKTTYELATNVCRATSCPKAGHGVAWGGTMGNIRQEVGGQFAPTTGDEVDVSFAKLPNALSPILHPLAVKDANADDSSVAVLTQAQ